jgi:hypothetical protein
LLDKEFIMSARKILAIRRAVRKAADAARDAQRKDRLGRRTHESEQPERGCLL